MRHPWRTILKILISDDSVVIDLEENLSMESIQSQLEILKEGLLSEKFIVLKAPEVSELSAASLQLLLSFIKEVKAKGLGMSFEDVSPVFHKWVTRLGLNEDFNLSLKEIT